MLPCYHISPCHITPTSHSHNPGENSQKLRAVIQSHQLLQQAVTVEMTRIRLKMIKRQHFGEFKAILKCWPNVKKFNLHMASFYNFPTTVNQAGKIWILDQPYLLLLCVVRPIWFYLAYMYVHTGTCTYVFLFVQEWTTDWAQPCWSEWTECCGTQGKQDHTCT